MVEKDKRIQEQVSKLLAHSEEIDHSQDGDSIRTSHADETVPGLKVLTSIMQATLFTDLFCHHAHIRYLHSAPEERVDALRKEHPKFYSLCRNSDYVSRLFVLIVVVLLSAGIIGAAAWKLIQ